MPTHVSPLRYPGGKQSLAPLLSDLLVHNDLHESTMIEAFAGGAGASLQLMLSEYVTEIQLNDADSRIFGFWRAVFNQTEALVKRIQEAEVTLETWHRCREIYNAPTTVSQIDLAFAVFFLNRCNRSGILMGGGPIGGYEQNGPWKLDARFNRAVLIDRIRRVAEYRGRVTVTRLDALKLLREIPRESTPFVYLDPPYFEKGQRLYMNSMEPKDHAALAELLHGNPSFHWVLTYDAAPEIRKLYKGFKLHEFGLRYSAAERRSGSELLIVDPRLEIPRTLLKANNRPGKLRFTK